MGQAFGINTIVVPLDGSGLSERALAPAADLARVAAAKLCLVTAVDAADEQEATLDYLREAASRDELSAADDVEVDARVDPTAVDAIARAVRGDRVICMATSSTLVHRGGYLGSMAERVLRRSGQPTVLIGPEAELAGAFDVERVVVPLDGSELAEIAVGIGADWARLLGVPIRLLEVQTPRDARANQTGAGMDGSTLSGAYLRSVANGHADDGLEFEWETARDRDYANGILDNSRKSLIVMTTHGRTGLRRIVMGSVATRVVADARHPVIVACPGTISDT